jgi:hypothetical protein
MIQVFDLYVTKLATSQIMRKLRLAFKFLGQSILHKNKEAYN